MLVMIKILIRLGAAAAAITAIVALWALIGGPMIATSADVRRLDRSQAEIAVEVYDTKLRRYLAVAPPTDPVAKQNWDEEIRRSRQQLDDAEKKRIELSK